MIAAMTTRPHSRDLRIGRFSEIGRGYLITTVTQNRLPLFADYYLARLAIRELRACDEAGLCATLAFVLMPDHLHWLLQLTGNTVPDLLRRYKSRSGGVINRSRDTPGMAVWQAGFHDRAIRDGEDVRHIARYIVANPVRAGLVGSIREYSHWDAAWL
jgi:REP element-mobilizing transposase RayT